MSDFNQLTVKIKYGSALVSTKKWRLSDYYLYMAEYFESLTPSSGTDVVTIKGVKYGGYYNFRNDAEELRMLAMKVKSDEKK